ncbi:MAG: hypothetical protein B7X04_01515 [Parcubacteria group bacterium 21-54-25]|nr:MAG: hypothetical protein B7X04_01515 [Parcubacteria group bacterium 21-54-25]HQU07604.1 type IV secretion system DNA-binding domain-containing protein [Candidatus Paceibacterota bacterium]
MPRTERHQVTYLAKTDFRNQRTRFGIKERDRLLHLYAIGQTGTGKSTLLETLIRQDLAAGRGLALLDPHGDLVERLAAQVPPARRETCIYMDAPDPHQPYGYNPLKQVAPEKRPLAAAGMLEVFKKMWEDAWGPRMEHILRNALLALLDYPDATLLDLPRLLDEREFRRRVGRTTTNPQVAEFLLREYERYTPRMRSEAIAPIQNKVGAFLADPTLRRILCAPEKPIGVRRLMDEGGVVLLVNLSKGRLGEDAAHLLGGLLVTTIGLAAFSRAEVPERERRPFFLYLDEFQHFTTLALVTMASELRKYGVGMVLVHQYLDQLAPEIRHAVLGNVGTVISFRVGPHDAPFLAREFAPTFSTEDLVNLPNHHIYLRLMIDGTPSRPFSARTLHPGELEAGGTLGQ